MALTKGIPNFAHVSTTFCILFETVKWTKLVFQRFNRRWKHNHHYLLTLFTLQCFLNYMSNMTYFKLVLVPPVKFSPKIKVMFLPEKYEFAMHRSRVARLGARFRVRRWIISCCLSSRFSATRVRLPPGWMSLAKVVSIWNSRMARSFMLSSVGSRWLWRKDSTDWYYW